MAIGNDSWDSADIDQAKQELLTAGWVPKTSTIWKSPAGSLHAGPAGAWKTMKRALNDEAHGILASQHASFDSENAKAEARIAASVVSDRARLDALIEAVRRFQTETHRDECRCGICSTLQRAITDALTPEAA